jgi:hypothetical protein
MMSSANVSTAILVSCLSNLSNDGRKSGATNCEPLYYICRCNRHCCYSYLRDTTLGLTLTFVISSGVALGQEGNAGQSNPGYSGASGAVNPDTIDDATLKQTAKAYV